MSFAKHALAHLAAPALLVVGSACSSEPPPPEPVGRWEFDAAATIQANRGVIIGEFGEQGADVLETALGMLEQSFEGAEMQFELAEDGTLTGHRRQPNVATGQTFEREENGSWSRVAPDSNELVLSIVDPFSSDVRIERPARFDAEHLEVDTRQGTATMTFVFDRVE